MINSHKINWIEIFIYFCVFIIVSVASIIFQQPISLNSGQGWDGSHYFKIAEQFTQGHSIVGEAPFCYRIGLPYVASKLDSENLIKSFKILNFSANVAIIVLFVLWIKNFITDWRIRCGLSTLLMTQWHGPFRFVFYYPTTIDNIFICFALLGLLLIHISNSKPLFGTIGLCLITFTGVIFREVMLVIAMVFLLKHNPIIFENLGKNLLSMNLSKMIIFPKLHQWLPLCFGLFGLALVHRVAENDGGYSFAYAAIDWAYRKPWFAYLHAFFIAFGPILALAIFDWKNGWKFLAHNQALLAFLGSFCLLSYIGGSDTERFIFWMFPVIYVLIGLAIQNRKALLTQKIFWLVLIFVQCLSHRIFWTLPDFPNNSVSPFPILIIQGNHFQYLDLYSWHGDKITQLLSLIQYLLLLLYIFIFLFKRSYKIIPQNSANISNDK